MLPLRPLVCAVLVLATTLPAAAPAAEPATFLVVGHPHEALPEGLSRQDARDLLAAQAAPFFHTVRALAGAHGGTVVAAWSAAPAVLVVGPPTLDPLLRADPAVAFVQQEEPEVVQAHGMEAPDELAPENTRGRRLLQTEEVWARGYHGEGVRVAILGTGIDPAHEAFRNADGSSRIVGFVDLINGITTPYDDHGHSTFVAASAVGSAWYDDPTYGVFQEAGVAPRADILAAKFLTASGGGLFADAIAALQWAFDQGADVSVNAWGSGCNSSAIPVMQTVRTLTDAGVVHVFSAGASGPGSTSIGAPACGTSAISVGAIGDGAAVYPPSSRGPCSDIERGEPPRICPDLVAKGAPIRSAVPRGSCSLCNDTGYRVLSGVSAPAGFVGGGVALIEQMKREITGTGWNTTLREEEMVLKETAWDIGEPGPDNAYGWGVPQLLNVHALIEQAPEARIIDAFQAPEEILRDGSTAPLHFLVRNLGTAAATGTFEVLLDKPDGSTQVLDARVVTLGFLGSTSHTSSFVVQASTLAGAYTLRARFDYAWTNATTGAPEQGLVERASSFQVVRPHVVTVHDIAREADVGELQPIRVTAESRGNEDATGVVVRFTFPGAYEPLHLEAFDPMRPNSHLASPPPDAVVNDASFDRTTLVFHVGDLPQGASWSFETTLVAKREGAHHFLLTTTACDGIGRCTTGGGAVRQDVHLPTP